MKDPVKTASLLLRIGLGGCFLYASVASFLNPQNWIWFIPEWMQAIVPGEILLSSHGAFEFALALWLFSGWKSFFAATVAALDILSIILLNLGALDAVFRDFGLLLAALALATLHKSEFDKLRR